VSTHSSCGAYPRAQSLDFSQQHRSGPFYLLCYSLFFARIRLGAAMSIIDSLTMNKNIIEKIVPIHTTRSRKLLWKWAINSPTKSSTNSSTIYQDSSRTGYGMYVRDKSCTHTEEKFSVAFGTLRISPLSFTQGGAPRPLLN